MNWYASKISDTSYGIFDTFETDDARDAHLGGQIPQAVGQVVPDLLAADRHPHGRSHRRQVRVAA